jgi:hypothetical protein
VVMLRPCPPANFRVGSFTSGRLATQKLVSGSSLLIRLVQDAKHFRLSIPQRGLSCKIPSPRMKDLGAVLLGLSRVSFWKLLHV